MNRFSTIPEAIADVRKGKMLIIVDSPKRENEGDLFIAAETVTPATLRTMIKRAGGLVCAAITEAQARRLHLPLMVPRDENKEKTGVGFTVSVSAAHGITTGVSAHDRAKTIRVLVDPRSKPKDIVKPGHVFGLVARRGGLLERRGHTEAAVDLARLAGRTPAGVLCEIVGTSGRMAKGHELFRLARTLQIKIISVEDLVRYLEQHPLPPATHSSSVVRVSSSTLPTAYGTFAVTAYKSVLDGREHAALVLGKPRKNTLVRVHSQCLTGDTLFSRRCDCGEQLKESMRRIGKEGSGVIVYASQEGRGIGLGNKIKAYALQDRGFDTVEANEALGFSADGRTYEAAAHILEDIGVHDIRLLTNNPEKERQLSGYGTSISATIPLEVEPRRTNVKYLRTKKRKLGHRLLRV
ncbi:GTP cyclohydrolase II [Candidatus Kaiserbacteria bacterium]|nr:GTP cyclohydrolase II [Candidatus Kaiserbacteria bacterium]